MKTSPNTGRTTGHCRFASRRPRNRGRLASTRTYALRARKSLRHFRQASILAVAFAALLLLILQPSGEPQPLLPALGLTAEASETTPTGTADAAPPATAAEEGPGAAAQEATGTVRALLTSAYAMWPKVAIALLVLLLAWGISKLITSLLKTLLRNWNKAEALGAFVGVILFLLAVGAALSIIAGDVRALVGSVGLVGLALSWALQSPIESFTGWLLNSFKSYYRVGDRIAVGEVFGDVYKIDILTTTVWESGGPDKPVQGAQPTGALITFPNSEVLRNNLINYTQDFPFVWDEVTLGIANDSDLKFSLDIFRETARQVVGQSMAGAADTYRQLLERKGLVFEIDTKPQVYMAPADSWTNLTIRYLVPARERRRWAHELFLAVSAAINEHRDKISAALPRLRVTADAEGQKRKSS